MKKESEAIVRFTAFFDEFRKTDLWRSMLLTREDSPWHREANVAEHARMIIDWYLNNLAWKRNDHQRVLTLVAGLFHDAGKPAAETIKHSPERGEYRAYPGHEQKSADIWNCYAQANAELVANTLRLTPADIETISLFIHNHVPFKISDEEEKKALKQRILDQAHESGHRAWLDLLISDQHGRSSDSHAENLAASDEWIIEWCKMQ